MSKVKNLPEQLNKFSCSVPFYFWLFVIPHAPFPLSGSSPAFPIQIMKDKLLGWLNMVLVADVFLVLFGFGWLAIAAIGDALGLNLGLDLWHKLWQPLFNPAIGILMGGAILSGIISWVSKKFLSSQ